MTKTHYYPNEHEAILHLNELKAKYNNVIMQVPDFTEQGLYTFIIN